MINSNKRVRKNHVSTKTHINYQSRLSGLIDALSRKLMFNRNKPNDLSLDVGNVWLHQY